MSLEELEEGKDTEYLYSRPDRWKAFLHLIIGIMFFIGSAIVLAGVAIAVCSFLLNGNAMDFSQALSLVEDLKSHPYILKIFIFISSSLPMIAAAFLVLVAIKATPVDYLLLRKPENVKWVAFSLIFVIISIPLMGLMLQINELIDFSQWPKLYAWLQAQDAQNIELYEAMVGDSSAVSIISSLFFMAFIPALAEEIFFRGFLMNVLRGIFKNIHVAILVTGIIFSVIHLQFTKFLPMLFLATVFGYATYWSGSVWTSVIAHFINNSLAVLQLYFFSDGSYTEAISQGSDVPMVLNIVLIAAVGALFYFIQKNSTTKTENFYV